MKDFQSLDQSVRDLALQLEKGHKTFGQLIADQDQALRDHIDRRFDKHAEVDCDLQAEQQFKESLFFPEIDSRQDQIPEAYRGTCRWIFNPPDTKVDSFDSSDLVDVNDEGVRIDHLNKTESKVQKEDGDRDRTIDGDERGLAEHSSKILDRDVDRSNEYLQSQPWSNFVDWLEHGEGVYWINGKPGSGKSTLLNYITREPRTRQALTPWADSSDLVTASFFFWSPGTVLQKSCLGLLRSLLYQIADRRPELISIMMNRESSLGERHSSLSPAQINTWTEKRLFSVLKRFLTRKPRSISICFFIDGLDEFVGEEDILMETIRLLARTPRAKLCASSRPEQIFRDEFQVSPQLRLQDFNLKDIVRTAATKLRPVLKQRFQSHQRMIENLIRQVCDKAQGVF
jgi:NACHT domain